MSDKSMMQTVKDTFMSVSHGAAGQVDNASGGNARLHPASDASDLKEQTGLRDHGAGNNGPNASFREAGKAFEDVRKGGENPRVSTSAHGIDTSLEQYNAK